MAEDHRHTQLEAARTKLSTLETKVGRLKGRLQAALDEVANIEEECRQKGVDPKDLDRAITTLEQRYDQAFQDLTAQIEGATAKLAPYEEAST